MAERIGGWKTSWTCSKNAWRAPRSTCLPPRVNACECSTEKEEQIEKLGGFCQTAKKKKLLYTEDRLQVAREEIEHLRAYVNLDNLDTSFEAQVNTTDDAQLNSAVQETINTVAALAKKLLTLRGQLSS